ncbi:MAG: hypothetical protein EP343_09340 [Deltaproteobacteria bacterium]|nr:MAG: hypothetical protein EP343_09340 [Deltaproteobacteria bacterium]
MKPFFIRNVLFSGIVGVLALWGMSSSAFAQSYEIKILNDTYCSGGKILKNLRPGPQSTCQSTCMSLPTCKHYQYISKLRTCSIYSTEPTRTITMKPSASLGTSICGKKVLTTAKYFKRYTDRIITKGAFIFQTKVSNLAACEKGCKDNPACTHYQVVAEGNGFCYHRDGGYGATAPTGMRGSIVGEKLGLTPPKPVVLPKIDPSKVRFIVSSGYNWVAGVRKRYKVKLTQTECQNGCAVDRTCTNFLYYVKYSACFHYTVSPTSMVKTPEINVGTKQR